MSNLSEVILIVGGANSGKSEWAEYLARQSQKPVVYIATAQKNEHDGEWMQKIKIHQERRAKEWITVECPLFLSDSIECIKKSQCILIDSLGTYVANWLDADEITWEKEVLKVRSTLEKTNHEIIIVGEETGWGVVPAYELGRLFRSRLGKLSREIGSMADIVYLTLGGYAIDISKIGVKLPEN